MTDLHTVSLRGRQHLPVGRALNITSDPEFTNAEIFKYRGQVSKVILVGMGKSDNVNLFEPSRPQVRRNDILANVDPGTHSSRMKISKLAAAIDQHGATLGEGKK